jgi:hypothetical protein
MILAHINVPYVHQKDLSLAIKNVFLALRINFITKLLSLVKNAVLDVSMMQQKINVFARIQPYSSMELFALHVIILAIMISMKISARIVVRMRSIVSLERFAKPAPKQIPTSMAINVPHVLIKQSGTQLIGIVRHVKEEKFLLMVIANAHKRSNFGIRLTVLNVWFLNSLISLYLNAFSAQINKYMTLLLLNVLTAQNKDHISMVANALLALQQPFTIQKQKNVKNAH